MFLDWSSPLDIGAFPFMTLYKCFFPFSSLFGSENSSGSKEGGSQVGLFSLRSGQKCFRKVAKTWTAWADTFRQSRGYFLKHFKVVFPNPSYHVSNNRGSLDTMCTHRRVRRTDVHCLRSSSDKKHCKWLGLDV